MNYPFRRRVRGRHPENDKISAFAEAGASAAGDFGREKTEAGVSRRQSASSEYRRMVSRYRRGGGEHTVDQHVDGPVEALDAVAAE